MKKYLFIAMGLLGLSQLGFADTFSDWLEPEILNLVPEKVFVPMPSNSNKDVKISISGKFMNSCFRAGPAMAQVDFDRKIIYIDNQVYFYENRCCLQVIKNYVHTINLGTLSPGDYQIVSWDNQGQEQLLGGLSVLLAEF